MIYTRNDNGKPIIITPVKIHEGHKMLFGFQGGSQQRVSKDPSNSALPSYPADEVS